MERLHAATASRGMLWARLVRSSPASVAGYFGRTLRCVPVVASRIAPNPGWTSALRASIGHVPLAPHTPLRVSREGRVLPVSSLESAGVRDGGTAVRAEQEQLHSRDPAAPGCGDIVLGSRRGTFHAEPHFYNRYLNRRCHRVFHAWLQRRFLITVMINGEDG